MKFLGLIAVLLTSTLGYASTLSEQRASEMVVVLTSPQLGELLKQEDGVGNIESIMFVPSVTPESRYLLKFSAQTPQGQKSCGVAAIVSGNRVLLDHARCESRELFPSSPEPVCKNPSPIGCMD